MMREQKEQKGQNEQKERKKYYIELVVHNLALFALDRKFLYSEVLCEVDEFTELPRDLFNKVVKILEADEVDTKIWARSRDFENDRINFLMFLEDSKSIKDFNDLDELYEETNGYFKRWIKRNQHRF